jgi:hypothetical protein
MFLQSLSADHMGDIRRLRLSFDGKILCADGRVLYTYAVHVNVDLSSSPHIAIPRIKVPLHESSSATAAFKEKVQDDMDQVVGDILTKGGKLQVGDVSALRKVVEGAAEVLK